MMEKKWERNIIWSGFKAAVMADAFSLDKPFCFYYNKNAYDNYS